ADRGQPEDAVHVQQRGHLAEQRGRVVERGRAEAVTVRGRWVAVRAWPLAVRAQDPVAPAWRMQQGAMIMIDAIQVAAMDAAANPAAAPAVQPQASAVDVREFAQALERTGGVDATKPGKGAEAVSSTAPPGESAS